MPPRRPRQSAGLRLFSGLLPGLLPGARGARPRKQKGRAPAALGRAGASRRGGAEGPGRLGRRLRGTLRIAACMALLGALNLYVLYYRRGTSVPDLLKASEVGRQASLLPGLDGPPGTPPRLAQKRPERAGGLRAEYGRVVEVKGTEEEHLSEVLERQGVKGRDAEGLQKALSEGTDGHLLPGQALVFFYDAEDRLQAVDYERGEAGLRVERTQIGSTEHWSRSEQPGALEVHRATVEGVLPRDGGLYEALGRAGEGRPLGGLLCDVLGYDLDLPQGGKAGDRFKVVVEKIYRGGQFYRYGQVLAARWEGPGGALRALRHAAPGQAPAYYSPEGEDLRRAYLRSPLRLPPAPPPRGGKGAHGVHAARAALHLEGKKLLGADLPAPAGAPVRALAAGKVSFKGPRPPLGLTVVLSHGAGETTYGRLGHLARGLAEGQAVRPGQVIGYVAAGDKGKAPHLHLGVRQGGKALDPLKLDPPRGTALPAAERAALDKVAGLLDGQQIAAR